MFIHLRFKNCKLRPRSNCFIWTYPEKPQQSPFELVKYIFQLIVFIWKQCTNHNYDKKSTFSPSNKRWTVLHTAAYRGRSKPNLHLWTPPMHSAATYLLFDTISRMQSYQKLIKRPKVLDGWQTVQGWEQDRTERTEWTSPSLVRVWNGAFDAFSYPGTLKTPEQFKAVEGKSSEGGTWRWSKNSATVPSAGEAPPAFTTTVKSPETESTPKSQCSRQHARPDTHSQP